MDSAEDPDRPQRLTRPVLLISGALSAALATIWILGNRLPGAGCCLFPHPPIHGFFNVGTWGDTGWPLLAGLGLAVLLPVVRRINAYATVVASFIGGVGFALLLNLERGSFYLLDPLSPTRRYGDYGSDLDLLHIIGSRNFVIRYPSLHFSLVSVHTRTHPPGAVVTFHLLTEKLDGSYGSAIAIAALGFCTVISAFLLAGSARSGPFNADAGATASALVAVVPSIALYSFTSMDSVYAGLLSLTTAVLFLAVRQGRLWLAGLGGLMLGFSSFLTFAGVFVAFAVGVVALATVRPLSSLIRLAVVSLIGFAAALAVLYVVYGFDLLACYQALDHPDMTTRLQRYWWFGTATVYLLTAGPALACLGVARLRWRRPPLLPLILVGSLLIFALLPPQVTGLVPGEVERTWMFTIPAFAMLGVDMLGRWEQSSRAVALIGLPLLVFLSAAEAVLIQTLYITYW